MIILKSASITCLNTDAVVNAANEQLMEGGGVCGYIFAAAGPSELQAACDKLAPCKTGSAVITPAFGMKNNKYIIHAVGPIWKGGKAREAVKLYSAYQKSLELARENGCRSIGFPLLSAGIFGVPLDVAWRKALQACLGFCCDHEMEIAFAVPDQEIREMGERILQEQMLGYPKYMEKILGEGKQTDKFEDVPAKPDALPVTEMIAQYGERLSPHDLSTLTLLETIRTMNQTMTRDELDTQLRNLQEPLLKALQSDDEN